MKNYKYIGLFLLSLGLVSCNENSDFDEIAVNAGPQIELNTNGLDFSTYVSIGTSLSAGYTDGTLFKAAQENSFPNILAGKFGTDFKQPLMNDNIGGLLLGGNAFGFEPRFIFTGTPPPIRLPAMPTTETTTIISGPFNNMAVPGAKSFHMVAAGYGSSAALSLGLANPFYVRMASSPGASVIGDALAQNPTFFTLDTGINDVLYYGLSGGVGIDQKGNTDPSTYGMNDITDPTVFAQVFNGMLTNLTASGAKGVVATIPYIESLAFFTTVPNNALALDAGSAASLTGFFQAVAGIFTQGAIDQGVPPAQAQALGSQYAISFSEGSNRWIIDVPVSQTNPLGFRQMTENELLLLTIDQGALAQGYGSVALTPAVLQILGKLQQGVEITSEEGQMVLGAVNGLDDKDAIDTEEQRAIKTATDAYNATITAVVNANPNVALVDLNARLTEGLSGITFDNYRMTTSFVTGDRKSVV